MVFLDTALAPWWLQLGSFGLVCFFIWWLTTKVTKQMEKSNETQIKMLDILVRLERQLLDGVRRGSD